MDNDRKYIKSKSVRTLALCSMFIALTIIGAYIRIPFPVVPMTLQTLFVLTAAMLLGPLPAATSVGVYLALGLAGLPVFTSGGGIFYIFSPTFGYLAGFLPAVLLTGWLSGVKRKTGFVRLWLSGLAGILVIYSCGIGYLFLLSAVGKVGQPVAAGIFSLGFVITATGDVVKTAAAALATIKLRRHLTSFNY
jgi:biotin transport system substrate-specific component